jgi:hypothetical protein
MHGEYGVGVGRLSVTADDAVLIGPDVHES